MKPYCQFFFLLIVLCGAGLYGAQFSAVEGNGDLQPVIDTIKDDLQSGKTASAAARCDEMLQDHAAELIPAGNGRAISIQALIVKMMAENAALAREYSTQFDAPARQALENVRKARESSPEDFYAMSQRYPNTAAGGAACAAAADRAAAIGDWPSAQQYYRLARAAGGPLSDGQRQRGQNVDQAMATPAAKAPGTGAAIAHVGPVLFEAPWYQSPAASLTARDFPYQVDNSIFLVTGKRVLAFKSNGDLLWGFSFAEPAAAKPTPPRRKVAGGPVSVVLPNWSNDSATSNQVQVLVGGGSAQVVVVRGPVGGGAVGLLALRAADGQTLWTTADQDSLSGLYFVPDPVICGRMVYAIASDPSKPQPLVLLLALDVTSGREIWRCLLGSTAASSPINPRGVGGMNLLALLDTEAAGITVDGDQLFATPNLGCVFCLDRFDGKLRWVTAYEAAGDWPDAAVNGPRFDNHPAVSGDVVVAAGQDSPGAMGLDRGNGQQLWDHAAYASETLVGASGALAIFAGAKVFGVEAQSGQVRWTYSPRNATITGPPLLDDQTVFVPTSTGEVTLSSETGTAVAAAIKPASMRWLITVDAVRRALVSDGLLGSFGVPARHH